MTHRALLLITLFLTACTVRPQEREPRLDEPVHPDDDDDTDAPCEDLWFLDADGDGFGDPDVSVVACEAPDGHVANSNDCDPAAPDAHPDAPRAWHAQRAAGICAVHHYRRLGRQATTLLRVHRPEVTGVPPRAPWLQAAEAAADLDAASLPAGLGALQARLDALPAGLQGFARRVIAPALSRVGLTLAVGSGPVLLLDDATGAAHLGDETIARFKPGSLLYGLLVAITSSEPPGREQLVEQVWEEPYRPPSSDNRLHVAVTRLRRAIAPVRIAATPEGGFVLAPLPPVARRRVAPGSA